MLIIKRKEKIMRRTLALIAKTGVAVGSAALLMVPIGSMASAAAPATNPADLCLPVVGQVLGTCSGGDGTAPTLPAALPGVDTVTDGLASGDLPSIANVNAPIDICGIA